MASRAKKTVHAKFRRLTGSKTLPAGVTYSGNRYNKVAKMKRKRAK